MEGKKTSTTVFDSGRTLGADSPKLKITMEDPGHWHFSRTKHLLFHVADPTGVGVSGLQPTARVRSLSGQTEKLTITDGGDGTYAGKVSAWEIGSGYATSYSVVFAVQLDGDTFVEAWPFEVVRDGREDIFKGDGRYSYQVRYGWVPGRPVADAERATTFYFEPRRSLKEGDALDRKQPWRAPSDHIPALVATVVIASADGQIRDEVPAIYAGLGVYTAERRFSPTEVGAGRDYRVSFSFIDPYNGEAIGPDDNAYALSVLAGLGSMDRG